LNFLCAHDYAKWTGAILLTICRLFLAGVIIYYGSLGRIWLLVAGCWNKFIFLILTSTSFVRHCLNRAAVIKALEKKATDTNWKFSEFLLDQMRELINCFHEGHKVAD
jgi:hypothetical protein